MARSVVEDPIKIWRFRVFIDGFQRATFTECSGLERATEVVEYAEGGSETNQKSAGRAQFPNITLKRGQIVGTPGEDDMFTIAQKVYVQGIPGNPAEYRFEVDIVQYDARNAEVRRWTLEEAWSCRWRVMSDLNGQESANSFEEIELCYEGFLPNR